MVCLFFCGGCDTEPLRGCLTPRVWCCVAGKTCGRDGLGNRVVCCAVLSGVTFRREAEGQGMMRVACSFGGWEPSGWEGRLLCDLSVGKYWKCFLVFCVLREVEGVEFCLISKCVRVLTGMPCRESEDGSIYEVPVLSYCVVCLISPLPNAPPDLAARIQTRTRPRLLGMSASM
jgi:hypothetical protein